MNERKGKETPLVWDDVDPRTRRLLLALDKLDLAALDVAARALTAEGLPKLVPLMLRAAILRALVEGGVLNLDDDEHA
jgi:hypothetical protein